MGTGWQPRKGAAGGRGSRGWACSAKAPVCEGWAYAGLICRESVALPSRLRIISDGTCPLESSLLIRRA